MPATAANSPTDTGVKDALDHLRVATQDLHKAVADAVAKRGGATKADLEAFAQKAKAATESAKKTIATQHDAAKAHVTQAISQLETLQKHIDGALKTSGEAFQTGVRQIAADARATTQKVSEAIAAARSTKEQK